MRSHARGHRCDRRNARTGLPGSLMVGVSFAKALALGRGIPLVAVNHLEGHVYSVLLEDPPRSLPMLCLIVSGGHTQLVMVDEDLRHTTLGRTRDDAAGEAFDKIGKLLGLGYPAGRSSIASRNGDPRFHASLGRRPEDSISRSADSRHPSSTILNRIPSADRDDVHRRSPSRSLRLRSGCHRRRSD
jgi:hypothetical protein